jgi:hypothetical protein
LLVLLITEFVKGYLRLNNSKYNKNILFEDIFSYDLWVPLKITKKEA